MFTVRDFTSQMYRLITASNPTVPLHGDDQNIAIQVMNQILTRYSSNGLLLTIAQTVTIPVNLGITDVWFVPQDYPTQTVQTEIVTLTSGSPSFSVANGSHYNIGDTVTGNGIPALAVITNININVITLSANATINGSSNLTFTHNNVLPNVAYIRSGRLANLDNAWLVLNGVTYPLIDKSRDVYLSAWKYQPLQGLPRFIITFPDTGITKTQLYPAPSQFFSFFARGKFQQTILTANDTLDNIPEYFQLFFLYAVAKYVAKFTGRGSAWTDDLEGEYRELKAQMEAASEINLSIAGDEQSLLNGAWRTRAGI